jgi:hypothetical protein
MVRKRKFVEAVGVSNAGGRKGRREKKTVKWIKISLDDLYSFGHLDMTATSILKNLLEIYNAKYELLANESPDTGTDYHVNDRKFIDAMEEAYMSEYPLEAVEKVIKDYAVKRGAGAVVELFDGYEHAWALVFEKG